MTSAAILAHFDPDGQAAPYVLRLLDQLAGCFDEVVVASTARLTDEARAQLAQRSTLIERDNLGQDFGGWQEVLRDHVRVDRLERLLLTNDTYVGMLRPLGSMIDEMNQRPLEYWGVTENLQIAPHIQSFFVMANEPLLRSRIWAKFWSEFTVHARRKDVIIQQEVGMSRAFHEAGFDGAPYFQPTADDLALAAERETWRRGRLAELNPDEEAPTAYQTNYTYALADAALQDGRLPLVKIEVLRYDPCFLGDGVLLKLCEERLGDAFDGVRDYLARTAPAYPPRPGENPGGAHLPDELESRLGYRNRL